MKYFTHLWFNLFSILFFAIFVFISCNFSDPVSPSSGKIENGDFVDIVSFDVGPGGGKITYTSSEDSLNGLSIGIPQGSFSSNRSFDIQVAPITKHTYGSSFVPLTPIIRISNGGGYSDSIMTLEIPINLPDGYFPMAFYYDNETGELEGIPSGAITDDIIYIGTRHFDGKSLSDGKLPKIQSTQTYADIIVAAVKLNEFTGVYDSKFAPGVDDWEFSNWGSYIAPGGHCSGQSLSAMWYYSVKKLKENKHSLYAYYDEVGYGIPDTMWMDNPKGYRLASVVQEQFKLNYVSNYRNWMTKFEGIGTKRFTRDSLHYFSFLYALKVIQKPQLTGIYSSQGGGHSMVVFKGGNGRIYVADPNYPGVKTREIEFVNGHFKPYMSGDNAGNLGEPFETIYYEAKSAFIDFGQIEKAWDDLEHGTIGNGSFPAVSLEYKNDKGDFVPFPDPIIFTGDSVSIRCVCESCGIQYPDKTTFIKITDEKGHNIAQTDADGVVKIFQSGPNSRYGLTIYGSPNNNIDYKYIDFKWITITKEKLEVKATDKDEIPIKKAGEINVQYGFKLNTYGLLPNSPKLEWDFGDGTEIVSKTGKDTTANHKYTKEGVYEIKVKLYNNENSTLIGEAKAKAMIGNNPIISSISVSKGPNGQIVDIYGTSFGPTQRDGDDVCLFFNGSGGSYRALESIEWSDSKIRTQVNTKNSNIGTIYLKVRLYDSDVVHTRWSNAVPFEVVRGEIQDVTPDILLTDSIVTITGIGFGTYTAEDRVYFYDQCAKNILSWDDNKITCISPKIYNGNMKVIIDMCKGMTDPNNSFSGVIYRFDKKNIFWQPTPSFIFEYLPNSTQDFTGLFHCDVDVSVTYYDENGEPTNTYDYSTIEDVYLYNNNHQADISVNGRNIKITGDYGNGNGSFECVGVISKDGSIIETATIIRKDGSNRVNFRCTIENLPLNGDDIMPLPMLDNKLDYTWTYSSNTSAYSMITDYYTAGYTSEGKLKCDSKVRGARRLTLRLSGAKKQ
ncbi:MAG: IPT/TIG domain-containing protein [Chloroherpetonaceae bacterium]